MTIVLTRDDSHAIWHAVRDRFLNDGAPNAEAVERANLAAEGYDRRLREKRRLKFLRVLVDVLIWLAIGAFVIGGCFTTGYFVYNEASNDYAGMDRDEALKQADAALLNYLGQQYQALPKSSTIHLVATEKTHILSNEAWLLRYRGERGDSLCVYAWDPSRNDADDRSLVRGICPPEKPSSKPAKAFPQSFGDGTYLVGTDIAPGAYVSPGGHKCYWGRYKPPGSSEDIIQNQLGVGQVRVFVNAGELLEVTRCGRWTHG